MSKTKYRMEFARCRQMEWMVTLAAVFTRMQWTAKLETYTFMPIQKE